MRMDALTPSQLATLEAALRAMVAQLEETIEDAAASVQAVELDQAAVGRVSRIDAIQRQSLAQASREALKTRRRLAQQALAAMEEGTYGECRRCEEPIAFKRLEARPESPFCLRCAR